MIIINLNIRGMGGGTKARYLNHLISREGAEFVCLQETKAMQCSDAKCYSLWGDNKVGWLHYKGDNGGGSLLSMWHKDVFIYDSHVMGKGFIFVFGLHVKANCRCGVVNVYAPCSLREKKVLWGELTRIKLAYQDLIWCFFGDFNAVRILSERKGTRERESQSSEIRDFNRFIDTNLLIELPYVGKNFTWFNSNGMAKSRLDRVLVSEDWMHIWPSCKQYVQRREVSDHCALVVKSVDKDWGPKPFKTIDAWLSEKGFMKMVKDRWSAYPAQGNSFMKVKDKLKWLKGDLKVWNRDTFGNMETKKKRILQEIEDLDCQDCNGNFVESERLRRIDLVGHLKEIDNKLDSLLRQKSRVRWFKNGDSCTKFFYSTLR
ncbi:uncharacterized protein [Phaseolus vulgaris]|uniref:uncharacterized protein isoform X1 n=1 Tax=Phaseolus vulgaris TaxID=3885 RepID=UPI0035CC0D8E